WTTTTFSSTHCWPTRLRSRSSRRRPDARVVADQGRARLSLRLVGLRLRRLGDLHRALRVDEGPDGQQLGCRPRLLRAGAAVTALAARGTVGRPAVAAEGDDRNLLVRGGHGSLASVRP